MGLAFLTVLDFRQARKYLCTKTGMVIMYVLFAAYVFYPIFRCYFRIPYLFCHVCPRKCIFGQLRPYTVPSALLLNFSGRFWCTRMCPAGIMQANVARKKACEAPKGLGYIVLLAVIALYFSADQGMLFKNIFSVSSAVIAFALAFIALSVFVARPWCSICPIGVAGNIILKAQKAIQKC
ncbi:MAG: 4Fe-4S binding protein [archaeon]